MSPLLRVRVLAEPSNPASGRNYIFKSREADPIAHFTRVSQTLSDTETFAGLLYARTRDDQWRDLGLEPLRLSQVTMPHGDHYDHPFEQLEIPYRASNRTLKLR